MKSTDQRKRNRTSITRLVLPFIDDQLTRSVQAVVRGSGQQDLGVAWTNDNTIKQHLIYRWQWKLDLIKDLLDKTKADPVHLPDE
ncbi:hypothetical protein FJT64_023588 [Amphibalanus amphitrite]|uniref:Uncharacterized protein n=1 Tax=Amphibalanus amphitrite TaxID=1232801 RepID=A0A6A4WH95_AMPAM|nr:hypothetical protein FJT64_023588 [Amphibalanus amphitrite]